MSVYIILVVINIYFQYRSAMIASKISYDGGDVSAYAWMWLLPFFLIYFALMAVKKFLAFVIASEVLAHIYNWWRKDD